MKPPAALMVRFGLTSTPSAHTEGVCSLVAKYWVISSAISPEIRLLKPQILHNREGAVPANCAGNVQLALFVERDLHHRVRHIAAHVAGTV